MAIEMKGFMSDNGIEKRDEAITLDEQLRATMKEAGKAKRAEKLAKTGTERRRLQFKEAKKAFKSAKRKAKTAAAKLSAVQKELRELLKKSKTKRITTKP